MVARIHTIIRNDATKIGIPIEMGDRSQQTRQTLVAKLQDRYDDQSWDEFVVYYRPYIYSIVRSQEVAPDDREDVVQDVCLKIWKALPAFSYDREKCRFRTWIAVIARNAVRDFLKRKTTRNRCVEVSLDESPVLGHDAEIRELAEREWKQHVTQLAWEAVHVRFSAPVLAAFEAQAKGRPGRVVAKELGIAENTVHVYQSRVRKAMMKEILRLDAELG